MKVRPNPSPNSIFTLIIVSGFLGGKFKQKYPLAYRHFLYHFCIFILYDEYKKMRFFTIEKTHFFVKFSCLVKINGQLAFANRYQSYNFKVF